MYVIFFGFFKFVFLLLFKGNNFQKFCLFLLNRGLKGYVFKNVKCVCVSIWYLNEFLN